MPRISTSALWLCVLATAAVTLWAAPDVLAESPGVPPMHVNLPEAIDGWTSSKPAKKVEPKAIFDYMDGAGELYLGYRFRLLEVYEYTKAEESDILVELYWMETADDAYGLLSGDWGGEPADLGAVPARDTALPGRALYGAGLLRIWSGDLYARVMSYQETEESKQAVLALGKAIVAGRAATEPPRLIQALAGTVGQEFALRADRTVYFRSHLVLNSVYFLSPENLLNLGLECEVAAAVYRRASQEGAPRLVHVLVIRYPDSAAAHRGLAHFQTIYMPGKPFGDGERGAASIEDGWMGYIVSGRGLGLVFEAPDEPSTRLFLESAKQSIDKVENWHE